MLFEKLLQRELAQMHKEGVKVAFIGDLSALPAFLQNQIERSQIETARNQAIYFNIAVNYGSRKEITKICHQIASKVKQGELNLEEISESLIAQHLYKANTPDPDLLIRTSGEMRLSNFLLWQMAYTEMYFTDVLFPDFDRVAFHQALLYYQKRDRRFGKIAASAWLVAIFQLFMTSNTLKEFLEACETLSTLRLIVTSSAAVLEARGKIQKLFYAELPKGKYANMHTEGFEFHLNMDEIIQVKFETGEAKRGNFTTYAIRLLDKEGKSALSLFLQWGKPGEYENGQVEAWQALKEQYGEVWNPDPVGEL